MMWDRAEGKENMVVNNKKKATTSQSRSANTADPDTHRGGVAKLPQNPKNLQGKKSKDELRQCKLYVI
jgi:hypothetical protein